MAFWKRKGALNTRLLERVKTDMSFQADHVHSQCQSVLFATLCEELWERLVMFLSHKDRLALGLTCKKMLVHYRHLWQPILRKSNQLSILSPLEQQVYKPKHYADLALIKSMKQRDSEPLMQFVGSPIRAVYGSEQHVALVKDTAVELHALDTPPYPRSELSIWPLYTRVSCPIHVVEKYERLTEVVFLLHGQGCVYIMETFLVIYLFAEKRELRVPFDATHQVVLPRLSFQCIHWKQEQWESTYTEYGSFDNYVVFKDVRCFGIYLFKHSQVNGFDIFMLSIEETLPLMYHFARESNMTLFPDYQYTFVSIEGFPGFVGPRGISLVHDKVYRFPDQITKIRQVTMNERVMACLANQHQLLIICSKTWTLQAQIDAQRPHHLASPSCRSSYLTPINLIDIVPCGTPGHTHVVRRNLVQPQEIMYEHHFDFEIVQCVFANETCFIVTARNGKSFVFPWSVRRPQHNTSDCKLWRPMQCSPDFNHYLPVRWQQ